MRFKRKFAAQSAQAMAGSLSIDTDPCIVLSVLPYNDGRRVVRILSESLGAVALWVPEGSGKKRQVGKWHPGALLELRGLTRKGSEGLIRFKEARRKFIPESMFRDVRKNAVVFFLCELMAKLLPEESAHPEVFTLFWQTLMRIETESNVAWIHAEFVGQLIQALGVAPERSDFPSHDVLDLQSGEWKTEMGVAEDHLPAPLGDWFVSLCEGDRSAFECQAQERKQLIQAQLRYLHHQMGGLREIKSYDVLEAVFA